MTFRNENETLLAELRDMSRRLRDLERRYDGQRVNTLRVGDLKLEWDAAGNNLLMTNLKTGGFATINVP